MKHSFGPAAMPVPAPVWVIGTYDDTGRPCYTTVSWASICCTAPPCVSVSIRKSRYSHGTVSARKAFTVCVPCAALADTVDYLGTVSGANENKADITGLKSVRSSIVDAPYADEFPLIMECSLMSTTPIGTHSVFIAEILDVKFDDSVLSGEGLPDISKLDLFVIVDGYRRLGPRFRQAFVGMVDTGERAARRDGGFDFG